MRSTGSTQLLGNAKSINAGPDQKGVALIMVLLIVAIIAVIATQVSSRVQLDIRKSQNRSQYQQAYWYALGGERYVRRLLQQDFQEDQHTHQGQHWAREGLSYPIEEGAIELKVRDSRACFNLNAFYSLSTPQGPSPIELPLIQRQFEQLLALTGVEPDQHRALAEALRDWVDRDTLPTGFEGAEDLHYSALTPSYLPANAPLTDLSELNLIAGFTSAISAKLAPHLCTLANNSFKININTLTPGQAPLLSALFEGLISPEQAALLLEERPEEGYTEVDQFWGSLPLKPEELNAAVKAQLSIRSEFFLARTAVTYYDSTFILTSRLRMSEGQALPYQRYYGGRGPTGAGR